MEIYNIITLIIVLAAIFGYINHRFIQFPRTIGIMFISLVASLAVVGIGAIFPEFFERTTLGCQTKITNIHRSLKIIGFYEY